MIVTIDEARVGHPSIKLDGMELAGMVKSYTLHHAVDEATTLELELLPGTDLSEVKAILDKAYADAKQILTDNRSLLDEVSEYLLVKETITGDELMAYVNADKNRQAEQEENTEA